MFFDGRQKGEKEGTLDEIFYNLAFECVVNGNSTKQNKTQMYPVKFQSIGNRDFGEIFRKNEIDDSHRNINDFIYGINDGDMFIEEAEMFYEKTDGEKAEFESKKLVKFQSNYDRLSRYNVESYLYDPINFCIALKKHAKEGVDLGFFRDCVTEMEKHKDLSDFFIADNVGKLNDLLSKANKFYLETLKLDLDLTKFKELNKTVPIVIIYKSKRITLNYFPILLYYNTKKKSLLNKQFKLPKQSDEFLLEKYKTNGFIYDYGLEKIMKKIEEIVKVKE